jgi:hypothetical protein
VKWTKANGWKEEEQTGRRWRGEWRKQARRETMCQGRREDAEEYLRKGKKWNKA